MAPRSTRIRLTALGSCGLLVVVLVTLAVAPGASARVARSASQALVVTPVMTGLDHPWDVAFTTDGTMFVTERSGRLSVRLPNGSTRRLVADFGDLWASGETGLMAVETDPNFTVSRRIYTCQGTVDNDFTVQVVAWTVDPGLTTATRANDPLVGGIDGTSGRHGGCQLRMDGAGNLWIGTGDAAWGTNPQDLTSLAGKTLRVNPSNGQPVPGNAAGRIFSYGHRNIQGLALRRETGEMWSVEHGSTRDDEINRLVTGGNYGWNPVPVPYNEAVPMTAPGAIDALWSSGSSTIAPSAATFLTGASWESWQGALAMSVLKDRELRIMFFDAAGRFTGSVAPPELDGTHGRLRAAELGPGGVLFVTTDNGSTDRVLAVAPPSSPSPPGCAVGVDSSGAGLVDMAAPGPDSGAWFRSWTGTSWTSWGSLGGIVTSNLDISTWDGRLDVFGRGADHSVWQTTRMAGTWFGWRSVGGLVTSSPTAVSWGPNRIDLFARGVDDALWGNSWTPAGWQGWYSLGGRITSEATVASWGANRLDVFARGTDGAIWHQANSGTGWMGWESLGGVGSSGPSAVSWGSNRIDLFVRGADGALWSRSWSVDRWSAWSGLGGGLGSAPAATSRGPDQLDVFVCGLDGGLYQQSWTGNGWTGWLRPG